MVVAWNAAMGFSVGLYSSIRRITGLVFAKGMGSTEETEGREARRNNRGKMTIRLFMVILLSMGGWAGDACAQLPNVVFLSVDTLRADRLGCYGHDSETSPAIDAFAKDGLLFEDCLCETPLTFPSFASMLTSRYPRSLGATRNGLRLPTEVSTVAELFHAAGYTTFCVQSNWTLKAKLSGLSRGFDVYDDHFNKKRWGVVLPEREAPEVTEIALRLLEKQSAAKPFFAWIHYTDPHAPYTMHLDYNPSGKRAWRLKNAEKVSVKYDSEVAYCDAHIARLLAALPENTQVLFVADHGESLYEHDYLGHGRRVYQTGLHIPLIIRGEGITPGRNTRPVRGIDVAPTLLGLAGIPVPENMEGQNLVAAFPASNRTRVVETYGGAVPRLPGMKALMSKKKPMRKAVVESGWKLILSERKTELYNLVEDPKELENKATAQPERVRALTEKIEQWDKAVVHGDAVHEKLSDEDWQALESLGYLE